MNAEALINTLTSARNKDKARLSARFFKTGPGEYGEGDIFLGLTVPQVRRAIIPFRSLPLTEVTTVLRSPFHEVRLAALLILVHQYTHAKNPQTKKAITACYVRERAHINNWDLVDTSAPYILGAELFGTPQALLFRYAKSKNLWERRIAIISTFYDIRQGEPRTALAIATLLLTDSEDLIHKAVGWMLREIGKRCGRAHLTAFLEQHAATMPRTMLRYAIEHLSKKERAYFMQKKLARVH